MSDVHTNFEMLGKIMFFKKEKGCYADGVGVVDTFYGD